MVTHLTNMSLSAKRESLARIHGRYERAGRPHKARILDEFCATCGFHRKAALRLLNRPQRATPPKRSGPKLLQEPAVVLPVLKTLWLASDQLCSKLLKAALPEWLEHHERRTTPLPEAFNPTSATGAGDGLGMLDHNYAAVGGARRLPAPAVPSNDCGSHKMARPTRSLTLRLTRKCGF